MAQPTGLPSQAVRSSCRLLLGNALVVAVLFVLINWAYRPSLRHVPRQDQWCYLLDLLDQNDFPSLFAHSYSWNRTRVVCPGDYQLYRPVFFALLSAETALWGTNFVSLQRIGIWLHCLSVFLLLQLLLLIGGLIPPAAPSNGPLAWFTEKRLLLGLAYALTLFFALNSAILEMVIWNHIHGYLLFIILALGATLLSLKSATQPNLSPTRRQLLVGGAFLLVLLAAFTYEVGQLFSVLVGAVLGIANLQHGRRSRALALFLLFAAVFPIYQGANLLDQAIHPQKPDVPYTWIVEKARSWQTWEHAKRYALHNAAQPFLPAQMSWYYFGRLAIKEPILTWEKQSRAGAWLIPSLAVFACGFLLVFRGLCRFARQPGRMVRLLVVLLPAGFFVLHGAVTVLGRMNIRTHQQPGVLEVNSYYAYFPLLGFLISCYAVATWGASGNRSRASRLFLVPGYFLLLIGLVVLGLYSGFQVRSINRKVARDPNVASCRHETRVVKTLIDSHKGEANFSIAFDETAIGQTQHCNGVPLLIILFKRYVNNHDPKYVISMTKNGLVARRNPGTSQLVGDLVEVGTCYNFFHFDGWYHAVRVADGYYIPSRMDYSLLIKDRTLSGVKHQLNALKR